MGDLDFRGAEKDTVKNTNVFSRFNGTESFNKGYFKSV